MRTICCRFPRNLRRENKKSPLIVVMHEGDNNVGEATCSAAS